MNLSFFLCRNIWKGQVCSFSSERKWPMSVLRWRARRRQPEPLNARCMARYRKSLWQKMILYLLPMEAVQKERFTAIRIMPRQEMRKLETADAGLSGKILPVRIRHLDIRRNSAPILKRPTGNPPQWPLPMRKSFPISQRSANVIREQEKSWPVVLSAAEIPAGS